MAKVNELVLPSSHRKAKGGQGLEKRRLNSPPSTERGLSERGVGGGGAACH